MPEAGQEVIAYYKCPLDGKWLWTAGSVEREEIGNIVDYFVDDMILTADMVWQPIPEAPKEEE